MDQELAAAAAYAPGRRFVCIHQMAALICVKSGHGRHLESVRLCHQIESPTLSMPFDGTTGYADPHVK